MVITNSKLGTFQNIDRNMWKIKTLCKFRNVNTLGLLCTPNDPLMTISTQYWQTLREQLESFPELPNTYPPSPNHTLQYPYFTSYRLLQTVWSTSLCKQDISRLQHIQNRAMRIIINHHPRMYFMDMLDTLILMRTNQRLKYNLRIFLWRLENDQVPSYLSNICKPIAQIHTHNTNQLTVAWYIYIVPTIKPFQLPDPKLRMKLPSKFRDVRSLYSLKKNLITHICSMVDRFEINSSYTRCLHDFHLHIIFIVHLFRKSTHFRAHCLSFHHFIICFLVVLPCTIYNYMRYLMEL